MISDKARAAAPRTRRMLTEDVAAVVALHLECFPEYFLTALGRRVLTCFYTMTATDDRSIAVVLEEPKSRSLIGIAAGTLNSGFYAELVRHHLWLFGWAVLWGAIRRNTVRAGVWQRRAVLLTLLRKLFRPDRGLAASDIPEMGGPEARFLDVAIHPAWRGRMNAEFLVSDFTGSIFRLGATRLVGTVRPGNLPSLILYKRLGWKVVRTGSDKIEVSIHRDNFVCRPGSL